MDIHTNGFRDIELHHENFYGKPNEDFEGWLFSMDMQLKDRDYTEGAKLCFIAQCMKGEARAWLQHIVNEAENGTPGYVPLTTWNDLKERLRHRFQPAHSNLRNELLLMNLTQKGDLTEYVGRFYDISSKLGHVQQSQKVAAFIRGYRGPAASELIRQTPSTIIQCIEIAQGFDHPDTYQQNPFSYTPYQQQQYNTDDDVVPMELGRTENGSIICYYCKGINHIARYCLANPYRKDNRPLPEEISNEEEHKVERTLPSRFVPKEGRM